MAWVAVDKDGTEGVYDSEPVRYNGCFWIQMCEDSVSLPKGSIKKLIGRDLDWNDEPVELKEDQTMIRFTDEFLMQLKGIANFFNSYHISIEVDGKTVDYIEAVKDKKGNYKIKVILTKEE